MHDDDTLCDIQFFLQIILISVVALVFMTQQPTPQETIESVISGHF